MPPEKTRSSHGGSTTYRSAGEGGLPSDADYLQTQGKEQGQLIGSVLALQGIAILGIAAVALWFVLS